MNDSIQRLRQQEEESFTAVYAEKIGMPYANVNGIDPDGSAIKVLPTDFILQKRIFPYKKIEKQIWLAVEHPDNPEIAQELNKIKENKEFEFTPIVVSKSTMDFLIGFLNEYYVSQQETTNIKMAEAEAIEHLTLKEVPEYLEKATPTELFQKIFNAGAHLEASDIHIEPEAKTLRIRYRLDGMLYEVATLDPQLHDSIISRIKLLSGLKLNIHDISQDGSFDTAVGAIKYDIRVSITPTNYGENAVLRLLPQSGKFLTLEELGLDGYSKSIIDSAIRKTTGLILNTGPTGSGKTTTLYAILNMINRSDIKIVTLEDPVEYKIPGITQTEINEEKGYGFAEGLRATMRQDPDIILVGEIRDAETAATAIQAALTGHLVLSTLHTNDAAGALPRLIELGVKPNLFAEAINVVIAQRLVRKINPNVPTSTYTPDATESTLIKSIYDTTPEAERTARLPQLPTQLIQIADESNPASFKGRMGVFETLTITPEIDQLIGSGATVDQIRQSAIKNGMVTMQQDGIIKVLQGATTLNEVKRVVDL